MRSNAIFIIMKSTTRHFVHLSVLFSVSRKVGSLQKGDLLIS